jgi:hypothetical protein
MQILTAVPGGMMNVTLPGFGLSSIQVSSSAYPFSGQKMTFFAIGGIPPSQSIGPMGFYASYVQWPSPSLFDKFEVLFSGQCYDNNGASGDGCNASYVEPMCRCSRTSAIWGTSVCSCARNASQLLALPKNGTIQALNLSGIASPTTNLGYSGSAFWSFDSCPHPALSCSHPSVTRHLAVILNGTFVLAAPVNFTSLGAGRSNLSVDLTSFGAPFPVGSRIKIVFWSNVVVGVPAGLFNLDGPFVSESPEYTIVAFTPEAESASNNYTMESFDIVGDFDSQIWLTSNVRFPSRIDFWTYNGPLAFSSSRGVDFVEDSTLLPASVLNCVSRDLASGSILHNCTVRFPQPAYPNDPSYAIARIWDGSNAGKLRSIGIRVLPQPIVNALTDPVAQNSLSIALSGQFIERRSSWQVYCGGSAIEAFEAARNVSRLTMGLASLLVANADVTLRWTLLGYTADIVVGSVFPCTLTWQYSFVCAITNSPSLLR